MKEIRDIIRAYDEAVLAGKKTALATVVHVKGSSYRRPGARMLITEDGLLTGAISGGCLEGDALNKARLAMNENQKRLITYDTSDDEDNRTGVGLGCNGIIRILVEPVDESDPFNPLQLLKLLQQKRSPAVLVTLFSLQNKRDEQPGSCFFMQENSDTVNLIADESVAKQIAADAALVLSSETSTIKTYENGQTAFVELVQPEINLLIFGAGNDVGPLAQMADVLGWEVTVADGRSHYATEERFPTCSVLLTKPEEILGKITLDKRTAVLLMTHNYNYDLAVLRQLAGKPVSYIGSLGPKKKMKMMVEELSGVRSQVSGIRYEPSTMNHEPFANLYGPTGLDIGSETPEEIALSIVAEIQAVFSGQNGASLRKKEDRIHDEDALFSQKFFDEEA